MALAHPLVQRAAGHRLKLVVILPGMRGRRVGVERLLVPPGFNHREMVRAHHMLHHVEPEIASLLATRLGLSPEHHRHSRDPARRRRVRPRRLPRWPRQTMPARPSASCRDAGRSRSHGSAGGCRAAPSARPRCAPRRPSDPATPRRRRNDRASPFARRGRAGRSRPASGRASRDRLSAVIAAALADGITSTYDTA